MIYVTCCLPGEICSFPEQNNTCLPCIRHRKERKFAGILRGRPNWKMIHYGQAGAKFIRKCEFLPGVLLQVSCSTPVLCAGNERSLHSAEYGNTAFFIPPRGNW
ncbi:hypothetical protein KCP78_25795 [Salmonella enterica subsp. enterica]|nr:hypothetical protein KCP78_25795 [Salmonella enterica subsp. enterica]